MREIKFRVWDKNTKELYVINGLWFEEESVTFEGDGLGPQNKGRYVLQQYTGLKDANGTEIYEGDIVKRLAKTSGTSSHYTVAWQNSLSLAGFNIKGTGRSLEVIGNIYENKES